MNKVISIYALIACVVAGYSLAQYDTITTSEDGAVSGAVLCGMGWPIYVSYKVFRKIK